MCVLTEINQKEIPLVVDLDGTLLKTDLLYEAAVIFIRKNPLNAILLIFWMLKGITCLKQNLQKHIDFSDYPLPYNQEFLAYLKQEKSKGRKLVLATGSPGGFAAKIAQHTGLFDEVYGSDSERNLIGIKKAELLEKTYGKSGFDYAGDSVSDVTVFSIARSSILVNPSASVYKKTKRNHNILAVFRNKDDSRLPFLKLLRIHQWLKNILIFVPLITSHHLFMVNEFISCLFGFVAFCICASSMYIVNDMLDLKNDRMHPGKKERPLASGKVSIKNAVVISALMFTASVTVAFIMQKSFGVLLVCYGLLTLWYSMHLKKIQILDTTILAALYTGRVFAGGILLSIELSFWLILFSLFIFYGFALLKRVQELQRQEKAGIDFCSGRGYCTNDIATLRSSGIISGFIAVVVFALYINSDNVIKLYSHPQYLWCVCPLLLYWINLLWLKTGRGEMNDDPVVFTIKNRASQCIFALVSGLLIFAK